MAVTRLYSTVLRSLPPLGPTYLSEPDKGPRVTARGTLGASMTASANASSIADAAGLSTCVRALAQVKSPRAPFDARSSDFGIS